MSTQSHRTDYIILGVLAAVVVAMAWFLAASSPDTSPGRQPPVRTTHSTHREGVLACFLLYEKLGVSVGRSYRPLLGEALADRDILLILDPVVPLADGERGALARWVRAGGVLICVAGRLEKLHGLRSRRVDSESDGLAGGLRGSLSRDATKTDPPFGASLEANEFEALPQMGAPRALLTGPGGDRIVERTDGKGRVIVLAESFFLANGHIGGADNAVLATNLVAYSLSVARGQKVAFDEYHLGFGWRESGFGLLAGLLVTSPAGWAVLCVTAGGLGLLVAKGRRFGSRRSTIRQRRRSKLEFVRSAGATCRAAGARGLTFSLLFAWFRRRCAEHTRLDASADVEALAAGLERIGPRSREEYEAVLRQGQAIDADRNLSKGQFHRMLAVLSEIEWEIRDGHRTSQ